MRRAVRYVMKVATVGLRLIVAVGVFVLMTLTLSGWWSSSSPSSSSVSELADKRGWQIPGIRVLQKTVAGGADATALELRAGFQWLPESNRAYINASAVNDSVLEYLVFNVSKRLQISCPHQVRIGRVEDGGWDACVAGPFNIVQPCLVYSIGMGGEWSFDNMITSKYGCVDMAYDPTLGKPDHTPKPNLFFYNTGIGGKDTVTTKHWTLKTFQTLLRLNNHSETTVDILKMDVEYSEWESLETMLADGERSLRQVKQLMVEFHSREMKLGAVSSTSDLQLYWNILRGIDSAGFKLWHVWDNDFCAFKSTRMPGVRYVGCFNMYFVNTKYIS